MKKLWVTVNYRDGYSLDDMIFECNAVSYANWVRGTSDAFAAAPEIHATKEDAIMDAHNRLEEIKGRVETLIMGCRMILDNQDDYGFTPDKLPITIMRKEA